MYGNRHGKNRNKNNINGGPKNHCPEMWLTDSLERYCPLRGHYFINVFSYPDAPLSPVSGGARLFFSSSILETLPWNHAYNRDTPIKGKDINVSAVNQVET